MMHERHQSKRHNLISCLQVHVHHESTRATLVVLLWRINVRRFVAQSRINVRRVVAQQLFRLERAEAVRGMSQSSSWLG